MFPVVKGGKLLITVTNDFDDHDPTIESRITV